MNNQINSASDNNLKPSPISGFVSGITDEIKNLVGTEDTDHHEELRIHVPIGFMRNENLEQMKSRSILFDMIFSVNRLRFTVELAEASVVCRVSIIKDYDDPIDGLAYYKIAEPLFLDINDVRGIIQSIGEFFKPWYFDIVTVEEDDALNKL